MSSQHPLARKDDLVVRELGDQLLIYDLVRNKALSLNRMAAAIWRESDGTRSASQIAQSLSHEMNVTIAEDTVWVGLEQLGRDHLLQYCVSSKTRALTRRQQLRSLGRAAAIMTPAVAALAIPSAAAAASCLHNGDLCTPGSTPCCTGTCRKPGNGNASYRCTGN